MGLAGVHSVLSSAVKEVTSPVPWPRALLELGEGRRGPGEGTARVTGRAGRRSELEAGVGGDPCSGSGGSTLFPGPSLRPCSPLSPACWPLLLGARLGPCALAVQRAGQSRVPLRPQHRAARSQVRASSAGGTQVVVKLLLFRLALCLKLRVNFDFWTFRHEKTPTWG